MGGRIEDHVLRYMPRIVAGLCIAALALTAAAVYTVVQYQNTNERVNEAQQDQVYGLRKTQYVNCVESANGLRRQVRREFVDLKRSVLIPVFSRVALTIPEAQPSRDVLLEMIPYLEHRIATIDERIPNVDCLERFPPLPGQHFRNFHPKRNGEANARETTLRSGSDAGPGDGATGPAPAGPADPGGRGSGPVPTSPPDGVPVPPPPEPVDPPSPGPSPSPDPGPVTPSPEPRPQPTQPTQPTLGEILGETVDDTTGPLCERTPVLGVCR